MLWHQAPCDDGKMNLACLVYQIKLYLYSTLSYTKFIQSALQTKHMKINKNNTVSFFKGITRYSFVITKYT